MSYKGARVTLVESIYFQMPGEQPIEISSRQAIEYVTKTEDEEVYSKRYKLSQKPVSIELGWLDKSPGMVYIRNLSLEGTVHVVDNFEVSAETIVDNIEGHIFYHSVIHVPPKQTSRFWPSWNRNLFLCSDKDLTAYVTILPR